MSKPKNINHLKYAGRFCKKIGQKYDKILVLGFSELSKPRNIIYKCQCDCGNIIDKESVKLNTNRKRANTISCGCSNRDSQTANRHFRWSGHGEIFGSYWKQLQRGAKIRNIEFSITIEYAWDLFLNQQRKCALSGVEIYLGNKSQTTASLDRIDSSKGYIENNIQWVHKTVNRIKQNLKDEEFIDWCKKITNNQISKSKMAA